MGQGWWSGGTWHTPNRGSTRYINAGGIVSYLNNRVLFVVADRLQPHCYGWCFGLWCIPAHVDDCSFVRIAPDFDHLEMDGMSQQESCARTRTQYTRTYTNQCVSTRCDNKINKQAYGGAVCGVRKSEKKVGSSSCRAQTAQCLRTKPPSSCSWFAINKSWS